MAGSRLCAAAVAVTAAAAAVTAANAAATAAAAGSRALCNDRVPCPMMSQHEGAACCVLIQLGLQHTAVAAEQAETGSQHSSHKVLMTGGTHTHTHTHTDCTVTSTTQHRHLTPQNPAHVTADIHTSPKPPHNLCGVAEPTT